MNYVVFGGSGFIGGHLVEWLANAYPEDTLLNADLVANDHGGRCRHVPCDVRKPIEIPGVEFGPGDVVVNLAAIHRTPGYDDHEYFETNVPGAQNVSDFAARHGIRTLLFASSIAVYGTHESLNTEDTLPQPSTAYGCSKLCAEHIHREWQAADTQRRLIIFRPGVVFGTHENGNYTRLYRSVRQRKFAYPGRKDTIKACFYIGDLLAFMADRLQNAQPGVELYNCTYTPAPTIEHIVEAMKSVGQLKRCVPLVPTWLLMPAAYAAKAIGSPLGICPDRVRKLMVSTNVDGSRMCSLFPPRHTLEEALSDWLRESGGQELK